MTGRTSLLVSGPREAQPAGAAHFEDVHARAADCRQPDNDRAVPRKMFGPSRCIATQKRERPGPHDRGVHAIRSTHVGGLRQGTGSFGERDSLWLAWSAHTGDKAPRSPPLSGGGTDLRSGPSSRSQTGRNCYNKASGPHAATQTGSLSRRENGRSRVKPRKPTHRRPNRASGKDARVDDVRGSPSCTGVGGVEVRKRGTDFRGVTPEV